MILNNVRDNPITFSIVGGSDKPTINLPINNNEGVLLWIKSNHYDDFKYSSYFINHDSAPVRRTDGSRIEINDVWIKTTSERRVLNGEVNLLEIRNCTDIKFSSQTNAIKQLFYYVDEIWVYTSSGWKKEKGSLYSEKEGNSPGWYDFVVEIEISTYLDVTQGDGYYNWGEKYIDIPAGYTKATLVNIEWGYAYGQTINQININRNNSTILRMRDVYTWYYVHSGGGMGTRDNITPISVVENLRPETDKIHLRLGAEYNRDVSGQHNSRLSVTVKFE